MESQSPWKGKDGHITLKVTVSILQLPVVVHSPSSLQIMKGTGKLTMGSSVACMQKNHTLHKLHQVTQAGDSSPFVSMYVLGDQIPVTLRAKGTHQGSGECFCGARPHSTLHRSNRAHQRGVSEVPHFCKQEVRSESPDLLQKFNLRSD